ncbi:MAG: TPM domain-containing protein [Burkholderiaceae bacterium]
MHFPYRLFRHLMRYSGYARRAFPPATLDLLQAAIANGELRHRAQLKLIIEPAFSWSQLLQNMTSRGRAHALFSHYRIWDTEENCGVLLYINLADQKVEIIADRTVARLVPRDDWEAVCRSMTRSFAEQQFHDGALAGVKHANALLERHLPRCNDTGRGNELSDRPMLL